MDFTSSPLINISLSNVMQGLGFVLGCFDRLLFGFTHIYLFIFCSSIATAVLVWHLQADICYN